MGIATFPSGDKYTGEYRGGVRNGKGKYVWSTAEGSKTAGAAYDGEYKDGNKHGTGTFTYPDKSKYTGQWVNGKREGKVINLI